MFEFFSDYTLQIVAFGSAFLGMVSGVVGSFAILKKQGLLGDVVSHASLPGIAIMFIFLQTKNTLLFMLGALISGLLASFIIMIIKEYSRIKIDSAMALVLSVFFGFGLVLLTYIQSIPNANQAGLEKFIFGQASTLLKRDVYTIVIIGSIILLVVLLLFKELKITIFDGDFADSIGIPRKYISSVLSTIIVFSIIIGLQTVGVILMSALLVAPGVAARQWTKRLSIMVILSGAFGLISGLIGTVISSTISKLPTGPTIVIVMSIIVIISILFAPNRGLILRWMKERKRDSNINGDKILLNLYKLHLNHMDEENRFHELDSIIPKTKNNDKLATILSNLVKNKYIKKDYFDSYLITEEGIEYLLKNNIGGENDTRS